MIYKIILSKQAVRDAIELRKNEPKAFKKLNILLKELEKHPQTGIGKPKRLKGYRSRQWSRRITRKHRLIYTINDYIVEVYVVSSYGHYEDR